MVMRVPFVLDWNLSQHVLDVHLPYAQENPAQSLTKTRLIIALFHDYLYVIGNKPTKGWAGARKSDAEEKNSRDAGSAGAEL